jgi:hypothetical protein
MTVQSVANYLGLADSEVDANKDVEVEKVANILGIADSEALLIADLGTPVTVPGAPTSVAALASDTKNVSVSFSPPASNGGAEIEEYVVTSIPGGFTASGSGSPITVTADYVAATGYTFTVKAVNIIGESVASSPPSNQTLPNP